MNTEHPACAKIDEAIAAFPIETEIGRAHV